MVAEQFGETLCPNVANLAQEETFAESEGVVIQKISWSRGGIERPTFGL